MILRLFQHLMYQECGVRLPDAKRNLVQSRLQRRVLDLGLHSFADYYQAISEPHANAERRHCIEALTTNETFFFRHKEHWDYLLTTVVPDFRSNHRGRTMKVWSAACSTGEEPYSIAIALDATLDGAAHKIYASDLNTQVVAHARTGIYDDYALQRSQLAARPATFIRSPAVDFRYAPTSGAASNLDNTT